MKKMIDFPDHFLFSYFCSYTLKYVNMIRISKFPFSVFVGKWKIKLAEESTDPSRFRQKANANLYHVTKFPLHLSFTVH